MRISDWSLDVCSSDLQGVEEAPLLECEAGLLRLRVLEGDAEEADEAALGLEREEQPVGRRQGVGTPAREAVVLPGPVSGPPIAQGYMVLRRIAGGDLQGALLVRQPDPGLARPGRAIGSASCRELVCLYVLILVVA